MLTTQWKIIGKITRRKSHINSKRKQVTDINDFNDKTWPSEADDDSTVIYYFLTCSCARTLLILSNLIIFEKKVELLLAILAIDRSVYSGIVRLYFY